MTLAQSIAWIVDDGHKIRIKVLAKEMEKAVDTLSNLQARALDLYIASNPGCDWMKSSGNRVEAIPAETIVQAAVIPNHELKTRMLPAIRSSEPAEEDLIHLEHQA